MSSLLLVFFLSRKNTNKKHIYFGIKNKPVNTKKSAALKVNIFIIFI